MRKQKTGYSREKLEWMLNKIPKGRVTRPGLLAAAMGTTPRAVAPAICRSNSPGRIRVVLKGGRFPHKTDAKDCAWRACILKDEGVQISEDGLGVLIAEKDMWRPY